MLRFRTAKYKRLYAAVHLEPQQGLYSKKGNTVALYFSANVYCVVADLLRHWCISQKYIDYLTFTANIPLYVLHINKCFLFM